MTEISLKKIIAPSFYQVHNDIKHYGHLEYWLKGGRGSTKSSFISVEIVLGLLKDQNAHAICFRQFGNTLETSVYNQIKWAISALNIADRFKYYKSPMRIEYVKTKQLILFFGLDDPEKIKSLKVPQGFIKYVWFEELNQVAGMSEIRKVKQSVIRGTDEAITFYSYNPPAETTNWVNTEANVSTPGRLVHHSTYLDVPSDWLGKIFLLEAEHLKEVNELAYQHEYLGEVTGTGLNVFKNIEIREIPQEERDRFDNIREGIDWGYAADPFAWVQVHYSRKYKRLYIFNEIYEYGLLNTGAMERIRQKHFYAATLTADSEDPKSIGEFWDAGFDIRGAKKGPGSRGYGFKFLQGLEKIIIDPITCPNAAREFQMAEFEREKDDSIRNEYPDKNDHTIDAVRYALEADMPYAMKA